MKSKKLLCTFLLCTALLTFIISVIPFSNPVMNGLLWLEILYYTLTVINSIALLTIVLAGIICLFKDNYALTKWMELLAIASLFLMLCLVVLFASTTSVYIGLRYILLISLSFVLVCLNKIFLILRDKESFKAAFISNKKKEEKIEEVEPAKSVKEEKIVEVEEV